MMFQVYGDPIPQGSKRAFIVKDRAVVVDANQSKLRPWRAEMVAAAQAAMSGDQFTGPVGVEVWFYLRKPKRPQFKLPATRPDIDKLVRAVLDALTASGVIRDDAQVTHLLARKRYAETPMVEVWVEQEIKRGDDE
jgi:Holliday junction resolvase RusA-like endonuclease